MEDKLLSQTSWLSFIPLIALTYLTNSRSMLIRSDDPRLGTDEALESGHSDGYLERNKNSEQRVLRTNVKNK